MLKLLIVEGNPEELIADNERLGLPQGWNFYADSIRLHLPEFRYDLAFPHAPLRQRPLPPLDEYDAFVQTGSGVTFTAAEPPNHPYLRLLEKIFATGKPVLGSCWGLQCAAVALGGDVGINPKGSEIGLARDIRLTAEGKSHWLMEGMPAKFDSPTWHRDHVTRLPNGAVWLAKNDFSPVQAMAYRTNGVDYVGVQPHPETSLAQMKAAHDSYADTLSPEERVAIITDFPEREPAEIADPRARTRQIGNWVAYVNAKLRDEKAPQATAVTAGE